MEELSKAEKIALRQKKRRRLQIIRRIKVGSVLCVSLAVILYLLSAFVFFKVSTVEVAGVIDENGNELSGSSYYTDEEIIRIIGVEAGDSLVLVSKRSVKDSVEKLLPYIGNVKVQRKYPSTLRLTVEDTNAVYALDAGGGYTLLDENYKVLEVVDRVPRHCANVVGIPILNSETGTVAEFTDEAYKTRLETVRKACSDAEISDVTKIDLSNIANVRITISGDYTLVLGTLTQLPEKLSMAVETINTEKENNPDARIIIDITDPERSYVRDDYSPSELEEESSEYIDDSQNGETPEEQPEEEPEEQPEDVPEAVG